MSYSHPPHSHAGYSSGGQQYLQADVNTSSPARLRLMLIERAVEVGRALAKNWREDPSQGSCETSLKLLDLLTELLSGVTGGNDPAKQEICRQVADLYVFLSKHLLAAERCSDAGAIDEIVTVLEIEAETWRAVCAQQGSGSAATSATSASAASAEGLNLQA